MLCTALSMLQEPPMNPHNVPRGHPSSLAELVMVQCQLSQDMLQPVGLAWSSTALTTPWSSCGPTHCVALDYL